MQRCPYIHEMKERLLGEQMAMEPLTKDHSRTPEPPHPRTPESNVPMQQPVSTVVRVCIISSALLEITIMVMTLNSLPRV